MEVKDLEQNMQIAPLLSIAPTVISYNKKIQIKIIDTLLLPNTTYKISLGNALVDNREATPYKNFVYTFSTGSYFDSLKLHGDIMDAATGKPDTAGTIMLYAGSEKDSSVVKKKPLYATKVDASGHFSFDALPNKSFHMYAVQDNNNNYLYDYGEEKIGFMNHMANPSLSKDSVYHFQMFMEQKDRTQEQIKEDSLKKETSASKFGRLSNRENHKKSKNEVGYRVNVDTLTKDVRTFELTKPLIIDLFTKLKSLDTAKIYLSYENDGIEVESVQKIAADSINIKVMTQWMGNKTYTLRLVKGWAVDTSGKELIPGKYYFKTKQEEDYSTLKIHIPNDFRSNNYVLYLYQKADSIYQKPITDSVVTLSLLQPGVYGIRIIQDENKNGKWDAGSFFSKRQPESVIPHQEDITVKAGWEHEVDFRPLRPKQDKNRPNDDKEPNKEPGLQKEVQKENKK